MSAVVIPDVSDDLRLLLSVGNAADRLGLSAETLRSWDRRYGLGPSSRTGGGHRRYDYDDLRRLRALQTLIHRGVPTVTAANAIRVADVENLDGIVRETELTDRRGAIEFAEAESTISELLDVTAAFDRRGIVQIGCDALSRLGVATAWDKVLAPTLITAGLTWGHGSQGIAYQHLLTTGLHVCLRDHIRDLRAQARDSPNVLLCLASEDLHNLPLVAIDAALVEAGYYVLDFCAYLPATTLMQLARDRQIDILVAWASVDRPELDDFSSALAETHVGGTTVFRCGPGWKDRDLLPSSLRALVALVLDRLEDIA